LKTIRRILLYTCLIIGILLVALVTSVFLFKDRIIQQFVREANKGLNTPVRIAKIEVSVFEQFPQLSIVLKDVYVEDSHDGQYPLLTAKTISFQMNPIDAWNGKYDIHGLKISDSETTLKINQKGENNYTVTKSSGNTAGSVRFALKNVSLEKTRFHYLDLRSAQDIVLTSSSLTASIETADDIYNIICEGQLTSEKIDVDGISYLTNKAFDIQSELVYNDIEKNLFIKPSSADMKAASFAVEGLYNWKNRNMIDLKTQGKNTDIQTLLSLIPEKASGTLQKYKSKGDVYFNARLKGEISKTRSPSLSVDFGFDDATIYHPNYKTEIKEAKLAGSFATADLSNLRQASLILKNIEGRLNNETFHANFMLHNFSDPEVICDFKGKLDASAVLNFYPVEAIKEINGNLVADISFEGKIGLLKNKATAQRVSTQGSVDLHNINLTYGSDNLKLRDLNGSLQFSNNDLALSNVSGELGKSDFLLNGFFKNIITFLLFEDQPIGIETDLKSKHIDLNELFALGYGNESNNAEQQYTFSISHNVNLNFNCDIHSLHYKRFKSRNIKGDLLVKNEVAVSRNLSFDAMGGAILLSGIVDAKNHKAIDVMSTLKLNGVNVDSAFYVFENFNQDFIEDRHLKGRATAEVNLEMTFNQHLKLFPETLIADIGITIKNGELNNFEPMKKLNRYLDDEGLSRLRFSDLKNDIHVENKTVYIPQMEVRSNVTDLKVSGTHTFDQRIDYRVVTPLRRKKIIDVDAQGAIEDTGEGQPKLFLKITGTTDDYKVAYDTEAVRKKIGNDIKREVKELKEAFKSKGKQREKELELEKDDYFDWEDQ
jgi:hypothetical protein